MAPLEHPDFAVDLRRRLEEVERYVSNQGNSISELTKAQIDFRTRLERLEELAQLRAIAEAREDERDKALYDRLERMEDQIEDTRNSLEKKLDETKNSLQKQIDGIRGIGVKAAWIFVGAFIVAAATFIIKGGLS